VEQDEAVLGEDEVLPSVQGWYDAPDRWRWDFGDATSDPDSGSQLISDGETVVHYDRETNTYSRQTIPDYRGGLPAQLTEGPPVLPASIYIGWLPYGDREEFLQAWKDTRLEIADGGEIAGRDTDAVTLEHQAGTVTLWIDRELPFVLKYEARSTGGSQQLIAAELVELALNEPVDAAVFRFEPPSGALEVPAGRGGSSSGSGTEHLGGGIIAPEGFLTPAYLPAGYVVVRTEGASAAGLGGRETRFSVRLEDTGGSYLLIEQQFRAGGLSETQKQGRRVSLDSETAYDQSTPDVARLTLAMADIVVTLESDALGLDELLRVAGSLR
jgi:outer membrane lipoprotein-sorting protein